MSKQFLPEGFLPLINSKEAARKAAHQGMWACILIAILNTVVALVVIATEPIDGVPINALSLVDAVIFLVIAFFIRKLSRIAAISGLALYWINRIYFWSVSGFDAGSSWLIILFTLAFVNSIRGTIAYHRFKRN